MASEGTKSPSEQPAHPQPAQAIAPYPPPYGAHYAPLPPGAYPPPFYTFAPITDPNHDPNAAANGAPPPQPYIMIPPPPGMMPGMVYAYAPPPPGQVLPYPPYAAPPQVPTVAPRPKRKQVKMACTNCAAACKRCDDNRPCERCQKYGLADSCVDGQRKERKKGIKRGPYKRKAKPANGEGAPGSASAAGEGEAGAVPAPYAPAPPEAYYPYYYPHPAFAPPPHDVQSHGEGSTNGSAHPVPQTYFPLHPAVYPPYPPYAPPVPYAAPPGVISPPPADPNAKSPQHAPEGGNESPSKGKKKSRAKAGEAAAKAKNGAGDANGADANGFQTTPSQHTYELPGGSSDSGHMVSPV